MTALQKLIGVLPVHSFAVALTVWGIGSAHMGAFVKLNACPGKCIYDVLFGAGHKTPLVCVFHAQYHIATLLSGKEVIEQSGAHAPDVQGACWTGGKSDSDFRHKGAKLVKINEEVNRRVSNRFSNLKLQTGFAESASVASPI